MELEDVVYGEIENERKKSKDEFDDFYFKAYEWLESELGFYPLFLAVGETDEDIRMTGYQNQWKRILSTGPAGKEYRRKGEFPNSVLFSFESVEGVFMDFEYWHLALNAGNRNYELSDYEKRLIFKPSWEKSKWLRKAKRDPHSVQIATSSLDLTSARRVCVRNRETEYKLRELGFGNVEVRRLILDG